MENRKLNNQQTKSSSSSELDESNDRNNNNNDKYATNYQKNKLIDDLLQQKKQSTTESFQLLNQSIMFRKISSSELHSASNHDFIINLDDKIEKTEKRVTCNSMLNSNDVSDDAAYADDNHEYEEDDLEETELNWQKCDYFIADKDVIKSKKLLKAKKYAKKTTTNNYKKSKTSIGNNRYYFKNHLLKNSKLNTKSNTNHHKSCLCCYLHEKYSEFITMTTSKNIINSTDINQNNKTNKSNFQSYLFDSEFLNYLKLIEYRHSPNQMQQINKNDNSNRVFTSKQNILNKATSFSLSMSNISLNDDDKVDKTLIASLNRPTTQRDQNVNQSKQQKLKQNYQKHLMSVISSSSMSSISSISESTSSGASIPPDVDNFNKNGIYHSNQIETMCNDLLDLNLKLSNDSEKVNQEEKQVLAEDLLQTQTNFFKKIFKIIETFINLNKYLIFKLNNTFTSFDNLTFENLFKFKKFDQFLKQSKPLMEWFIRNNYDEPENNQLKANDQKQLENQNLDSFRRSSSSCSGSKESDGFLILNNNLTKVNNNNNNTMNNDENNKTVLSFKSDLNDTNGQHSTKTEVKQQKENEPKFKRSRLNVDMEHSEMYSSNLNLSSNEPNEQESEKNNLVLLEEIKRLKKKLNLMCSKDYKIMRRSEYEALKFQLKAFRQDFQLEHNEKIYLRSNYEEKLRALEPCLSKINDENFNFVDF